MKTFAECFYAHQGRLVDRWDHYFPVYDRHLAKFQRSFCTLLEIGVSHGGSLQIWKDYLPYADVTGFDVDPRCRAFGKTENQVIIGDQSDPETMGIVANMWAWDIVIDDGSHVPAHQIASFNALWPSVSPGGVYIIEDCHTGWPDIQQTGGFVSRYPWMMVIERPKRVIRGTPSREMREDEVEAFNRYSDV